MQSLLSFSATFTVPQHQSDYVADTVSLATAHASPTGLQLCFAASPSRSRRIGSPASLDHRWAIVLAGGSGTRLARLVESATGGATPKQYCSFDGGRSLLGDALARADGLVGRDRVIVIVAREHERLWRRELGDRASQNIVVQPRNRGTAAGVLLPLLAVAARDPAAQVTLLPSDHFVADESRLAAAMRSAQDGAELLDDRVLLVGVEPDAADSGYGWIVPGKAQGRFRSVVRFVEKPSAGVANELLHRGALWNSFLVVGSARALLLLYRRSAPALLEALAAARSDEASLQTLYDSAQDADFCRLLLQGSEGHLALCVAPKCGWTDLGTPERVAACASWLVSHRGESMRPGSLGAAALDRTRASANEWCQCPPTNEE